MKKGSPFIAGVITATLVFALTSTALAASGQVSFNLSPIQFNGQQISAKGENYTLDNGCQAPSSITYTDEKGGGTTYLPARRIAEMTGVEIGYDATSGAVTVADGRQGETQPANTPVQAPSTNDYSDWSAEEEAAYQEFKEMWTVNTSTRNDVATANHPISKYEVQQLFKSDSAKLFAVRFAIESLSNDVITSGYIWFGYHGGIETETYAVYVSGTSPDDCSVTFVQD